MILADRPPRIAATFSLIERSKRAIALRPAFVGPFWSDCVRAPSRSNSPTSGPPGRPDGRPVARWQAKTALRRTRGTDHRTPDLGPDIFDWRRQWPKPRAAKRHCSEPGNTTGDYKPHEVTPSSKFEITLGSKTDLGFALNTMTSLATFTWHTKPISFQAL